MPKKYLFMSKTSSDLMRVLPDSAAELSSLDPLSTASPIYRIKTTCFNYLFILNKHF